MAQRLSRRTFLGALTVGLVGCEPRTRPLSSQPIAVLEARVGGRVGVYAVATDTGRSISYRGDERFAMCSTFKWLLAAAILARVDRNELTLHHDVELKQKDMLDYAPIAKQKLSLGRMTIAELLEAAVTVSDNTAANLLLERLGGPVGLTQFLRQHGDRSTRLDRPEPELNTNLRNDPRDTTTPRVMVDHLRRFLVGTALSPASRERLIGWMVASPTGGNRIRAGLPATFRVGDKTGTCGQRGAVNDVAIVWPPNRSPLLMAVYLSDSSASVADLSRIHADVARVVVANLL